jgi:prolyl 4-hydroxylase
MFSYVAFDLSTEDGRRFAANGGQRTVTVLIYLNDVMRGGATRFPALNLDIQPRRGMALVFFPATVDGMLDKMALHAALPAIDTKFVSQVWIRQSIYNGQPSKRLQQTLGAPISLQIDTPAPQYNHQVHPDTAADIVWQQSQSTIPMHF